tara:strand:- start:697 stop:939 length:243 start_codon:yes stop_codon:yes gene_type:complete
MSKQGKKKIGYKKFEELLSQAHQKIHFLADKFQELQTYFISYVEYRGDNIKFNEWMNIRIKELQSEAEAQKKDEQVNEKV